MPTKYKFTSQKQDNIQTKYLPKSEGTLDMPMLDATVEYEFDDDGTVKLTIEGQWFDLADIDELEAFVKAVKKRLRKKT